MTSFSFESLAVLLEQFETEEQLTISKIYMKLTQTNIF